MIQLIIKMYNAVLTNISINGGNVGIKLMLFYAVTSFLFWLILLLIDIPFYISRNLSFSFHYDFSKKGGLNKRFFITELYFYILKAILAIRPGIIQKVFYLGGKIEGYYKFGLSSMLRRVKKLAFLPFEIRFFNVIVWGCIFYSINKFNLIPELGIFMSAAPPKAIGYYAAVKEIIINNKEIILALGFLTGISNYMYVRSQFIIIGAENIGELKTIQSRIIRILGQVIGKLEENIEYIDMNIEYMPSVFLETIVGNVGYVWEDDKVKYIGKSCHSTFSLFDYIEHFTSFNEEITELKREIEKLVFNNVFEDFKQLHYYVSFEINLLHLYSPESCDYMELLDKHKIERVFKGRTKLNIKEYYSDLIGKVSSVHKDVLKLSEEEKSSVEYIEELLSQEVKEFHDTINRLYAKAVEEYVLIERYIHNYYSYKSTPLMHDILHILRLTLY